MNRLEVLSTETFPGIFGLPRSEMAERLATIAAGDRGYLQDWGHELAFQLPVEALGRTPYFFEASGVHFKARDTRAHLAELRGSIMDWLGRLWEHCELVDVQPGRSTMRLLDLHCPRAPEYQAIFGARSEHASERGFRVEVLGFGGGSKYVTTYKDTLVVSTTERCLEVWVPVEYSVNRYTLKKPRKGGRASFFCTVDPTGVGNDLEIKPAACAGNRCSVLPSFDRPHANYSLAQGAKIDKEVRYDTGQSMSTILGVQLPWNFKVGLGVNVVFDYAVDYHFRLVGPGEFAAYKISHLSPPTETSANPLQAPRILISTLGYAWEWESERK